MRGRMPDRAVLYYLRSDSTVEVNLDRESAALGSAGFSERPGIARIPDAAGTAVPAVPVL